MLFATNQDWIWGILEKQFRPINLITCAKFSCHTSSKLMTKS